MNRIPLLLWAGRAGATLGLLSAALFLSPSPVSGAAALVVNTTSDADNDSDGVCSLREAIIAANNNASYHECAATGFGDDVITFQNHTTVSLNNGPLPAVENAGSLTIDGTGRAVSISGLEIHQILHVNAGATLNLRKLTLMDGYAEDGGAVYVAGSLVAEDVAFAYNEATAGGAVYLYIAASARIHSCVFDHNQADWGGALKNDNGSYLIADSTFSDNFAHYGGAIDTITPGTVSGSTFKRNEADSRGSGIWVRSYAATRILNSTFADNLGSDNIDAAVTVDDSSTAEIVNATFSGNHMALHSRGTLTIWNSIIADGTVLNVNCTWDAVAHKVIDGGNNLEESNSCGLDPAKGSQTGVDPLLGTLNNYGGDTHTFPLLSGSPAIDGVTWNVPNSCPFFDQRGVARAIHLCDIGAYEADAGFLVFLPQVQKG